MNEFTGYMLVSPIYSKCDPFTVYGHWIKKDIGKPFLVWCNDGLYRHGINVEICKPLLEKGGTDHVFKI